MEAFNVNAKNANLSQNRPRVFLTALQKDFAKVVGFPAEPLPLPEVQLEDFCVSYSKRERVRHVGIE